MMDEKTERVLKGIRAEHALTGTVRVKRWLERHPGLRAEIEQEIRSVLGTIPETDPPYRSPTDGGALVRQLVAREMADLRAELSSRLGKELATRDVPAPATVAPEEQRERLAQLYAWAADVLWRSGQAVTRKTVQKAVYLLNRIRPLGIPMTFVPYTRGPYSRALQEAGNFALGRKWVKSAPPYGVDRGQEIEEASHAMRQYFGDTTADERLLAFLGGVNDLQLETWATVDMAARAVIEGGEIADVANVRAWIAGQTIWKKLKVYSDEQIRDALDHLHRLGLLAAETVNLG